MWVFLNQPHRFNNLATQQLNGATTTHQTARRGFIDSKNIQKLAILAGADELLKTIIFYYFLYARKLSTKTI